MIKLEADAALAEMKVKYEELKTKLEKYETPETAASH
jgi:hypothetical protein